MKFNIFRFSFVICLIMCGLCFTACKNMDRYLSVVPTDQDYKATLNYSLKTTNGDFTKSWSVLRKTLNICDKERTIIYVEYSFKDNNNNDNNFERTLMYINEKVIALNGESWEDYIGSFGDRWRDIYGSYAQSGSFVYEITNSINGRIFHKTRRKQ